MITDKTGDKKTMDNIRRDLYLDQPLWKQFIFYINDVSPLCIHSQEDIDKKKLSGFFLGSETRLGIKITCISAEVINKEEVVTILLDTFPGTII